MFDWLWPRPRCPLDLREKTWTEYRMAWLAERFGLDRLRQGQVILPNDHYFPDPYRGTSADARLMMDRLCGYMGVDPGTFELRVVPDIRISGATGVYRRTPRREQALVSIAESLLADPEALAATLAHELAHELLLGGQVLDDSFPDHEWITDLLPVYLGLGVFVANATLREASYTDGRWYSWSIQRQGYLPARMIGYALALFSFERNEHSPAWAKYLRLDAASAFRQGLRYTVAGMTVPSIL